MTQLLTYKHLRWIHTRLHLWHALLLLRIYFFPGGQMALILWHRLRKDDVMKGTQWFFYKLFNSQICMQGAKNLLWESYPERPGTVHFWTLIEIFCNAVKKVLLPSISFGSWSIWLFHNVILSASPSHLNAASPADLTYQSTKAEWDSSFGESLSDLGVKFSLLQSLWQQTILFLAWPNWNLTLGEYCSIVTAVQSAGNVPLTKVILFFLRKVRIVELIIFCEVRGTYFTISEELCSSINGFCEIHQFIHRFGMR